tara:strand:- start:126 stop:1973 length:1848 start_codon:yes stop_codon:yes gene_type:complete
MLSWTNNILEQTKESFDDLMSDAMNIKKEDNLQYEELSKNTLHYPFKLPIEYVNEKELHNLSPIVNEDLELVVSKGDHSIYDQLFQPTNIFGSNMIQDWSKHFTSNEQYLLDTQLVISEENIEINYNMEDETIMNIWNELKVNETYFLEKYCYIEWDILKILNRSSSFLQIMSVLNMMSPILSLCMPLIFLIFPFLVLKLRGIRISVVTYIDVLHDIAKHHFIGKILLNLKDVSIEKLLYFVMGMFMFCYQIYQNIISCKRFYCNIQKLSRHIYSIKQYLRQTIINMEEFNSKHYNKPSYTEFCKTTDKHICTLKEIQHLIQSHNNIDFTLFDIGNIGYLLKIYYELHSNKRYEQSLRYSFGFEGFLDNLRGLKRHIVSGTIAPISINKRKPCSFKEQYYPLHMNEKECVKNNCNLEKKIIITGPNASGKTTILKTTTINIIFSQQVGVGFYKDGSINPYTHIHSYLNIPDTSERDSLFQAESRRCKEIIDIIMSSDSKNTRHYGIFDELYSGTNPDEATKTGYAFLKYLTKYKNVDFVLTTHYHKICLKLQKNKQIQNYQMYVIEDKNEQLTYTYKLKKGVSKIQGAIRILEQMKYPEEIIHEVKHFNKGKQKK